MRCRPFDAFTLALALFAASGCMPSTQVGLTNVRAKEWRQPRMSATEDVIANGDESCERGDGIERDHPPIRLYRCPGKPPEGTRLASPR